MRPGFAMKKAGRHFFGCKPLGRASAHGRRTRLRDRWECFFSRISSGIASADAASRTVTSAVTILTPARI
jgi:hypothetical protein